jgi:hypothetical protein
MSKLITALIVVSVIVALGFISDGISRYNVTKQDENNDE